MSLSKNIENKSSSGIRVLITGPLLSKEGGVANYYSVLLPKLSISYQYFTLGSRNDNEGGLKRILRMLKDYLAFIRLLRSKRFDLVLLNPSMVPMALVRDSINVLIARFFQYPALVFIRGWDDAFASKLGAFPWRIFRNWMLRADGFIVLAQAFKNTLKSWGYQGPIFTETTIVDKSVDETDSLPDHKTGPIVLFLSRLEKEKGLFETIETGRILRNTFPDLRLIIAGTGSAEEAAKNTGREESWISFPGFVRGKEKQDLLLMADVLLFPSYREGMPNAVLEAMAYGVPVVTRPIGGLVDFFDGKRMGRLTDSLDPEELAKYCAELLQDPEECSKIGAYNAEYARERFMAIRVAQRMEKLFVEFL